MKTNFTNAVRKGKNVGDGTVGDLVDWLEKLINILFPENGIEYWSDNQHGGPNSLKRFQQVPLCECNEDGVHHAVCYARNGSCEGMIIEVGLYLRNGTHKSLTWAKTFGNDEETWLIVRAISESLESILFWEEVPEIVEMADKVPRQHRWYRETSLTEKVVLSSTERTISVATLSGGLILDQRDFSDQGENAKFHVAPIVKDWTTVLTNMKVEVICNKEMQHKVEDLPGYIFTDRGIAGNNGYYVLLPGGNPNDDREYLGFHYMLLDAITAARQHRDLVERTHLLRDYLVTVEEECGVRFLFDCKAETSGHAVEQAQNAYPGAKITSYQRDGSLPLKLAA